MDHREVVKVEIYWHGYFFSPFNVASVFALFANLECIDKRFWTVVKNCGSLRLDCVSLFTQNLADLECLLGTNRWFFFFLLLCCHCHHSELESIKLRGRRTLNYEQNRCKSGKFWTTMLYFPGHCRVECLRGLSSRKVKNKSIFVDFTQTLWGKIPHCKVQNCHLTILAIPTHCDVFFLFLLVTATAAMTSAVYVAQIL